MVFGSGRERRIQRKKKAVEEIDLEDLQLEQSYGKLRHPFLAQGDKVKVVTFRALAVSSVFFERPSSSQTLY